MFIVNQSDSTNSIHHKIVAVHKDEASHARTSRNAPNASFHGEEHLKKNTDDIALTERSVALAHQNRMPNLAEPKLSTEELQKLVGVKSIAPEPYNAPAESKSEQATVLNESRLDMLKQLVEILTGKKIRLAESAALSSPQNASNSASSNDPSAALKTTTTDVTNGSNQHIDLLS